MSDVIVFCCLATTSDNYIFVLFFLFVINTAIIPCVTLANGTTLTIISAGDNRFTDILCNCAYNSNNSFRIYTSWVFTLWQRMFKIKQKCIYDGN